jgi:hypothetical protein
MSHIPTRSEDSAEGYHIRVRGHLGSHWAAWFDGMTLTLHEDGTTVISGPVADQSALHGLLRKLDDLGVALVSVTPTAPDQPDRR